MTQSNNWKSLVQTKVSRRSFVRGLSVLGAGVAANSFVPGGLINNVAGSAVKLSTGKVPFAPIEPSSADDIILPEGYSYQLLIKTGDVFTADGRIFGDNADWTGWYPIDGLEGGNSQEEGFLVVNSEYLNPLFISGYTGEGEKTIEQINIEKAAVGINTVHIRKVDGVWQVVADSELAARYDATDPIKLVGPVAGADVVGGVTEVIGTAGNCSGGQTPWGTALSCEENYQSYYGEDSVNEP